MNNTQTQKLVILDFDDTCFDSKQFKEVINNYFADLIDSIWPKTLYDYCPEIMAWLIPNGLNDQELLQYIEKRGKFAFIKQAYDLVKDDNLNYSLENHFNKIVKLLDVPKEKAGFLMAIKEEFRKDLETEKIYEQCADFVYPDARKFMQKCIDDQYGLIILTQGDTQFQKSKIEYANLPDHQLIISLGLDKIAELEKTLLAESLSLNNLESIFVDDKDKYIIDFHKKLPTNFGVIMDREAENTKENIVGDDDSDRENIRVVNSFTDLSPLIKWMFDRMEREQKKDRFLDSERKMS